MNRKTILTGKYVLLIGFLLFITVPFIWLIYSSFRFESNMFTSNIFANEGGLTFNNYRRVFSAGQSGQFNVYFKNSMIIATISASIVVFLAMLGAYSLSRFKMYFKDGIILGMLVTNMFPQVLLIITIFSVFFRFNLLDSYLGIIITHVILGLPFGLWMVKGYFDSVPIELDEAAMIDGLNPFQVLFKIILPVAAPGMVVAGFYAFMVSWGDYLYSSLISQSLSTQTLPIGLMKFFGSTQVEWGPINAAVVITIIPSIILFAFLQKWVVEGLTSGAVKG